jgi:hypothetical protein
MRIGLRAPVDAPLVGDVECVLQALAPKLEQKKDRSFLKKAQEGMNIWKMTTSRCFRKATAGWSPNSAPIAPTKPRNARKKRSIILRIRVRTPSCCTIWRSRKKSALAATAHVSDWPEAYPGWEDSAVGPENLGGYRNAVANYQGEIKIAINMLVEY